MDGYPQPRGVSEGDGDPDPPAEATEEDAPQAEPFPVGGDSYGDDDVEDPKQWRRHLKAQRRARLRAKVGEIVREMRTPLRDVVRDHVLHRLPVQSLLRFRCVSADWRRLVSVPIFRYTQSHAHRSASGVFWQLLPGVSAYSPFDPLAGAVPDTSLSFIPDLPGVTPLASSNGLLCCAGILRSYYICNPSTAEWTPLPEPPRRPSFRGGASTLEDGRTAVALVFEPSAANLGADYHLVRPFVVPGDLQGVYGFQVFSSAAGAWRVSSDICAAEWMIPSSGVSAGGLAYFRTAMETAVAYDPAADSCRTVPWPMGYDTTAQWQLGEMDGRLCCACVTDSAVEVYALATGDRWSLLASYGVVEEDEGVDNGEWFGGSPPVFRRRPLPLRFQSGDSEVLLWVGGRVVGLQVASGRVREADVPGQSWMSPYADYVPHISTFTPVFPVIGSS